jgi:serine/threonine protein kinase
MVGEPLHDPMIGMPIGRDRRFVIQSKLGTGAYGDVYLARDEKRQESVAIKFLREQGAGPVIRERFRREGEMYGALKHPNLAQVLGCSKKAGRPFIAMEYIEGRTLAQIIDSDGPLTVDEALRVTREIASGLQHAHKARAVHRDLKPSNVMIRSSDGAVKILDFGVAKDMVSTGVLTKSKGFVGTPGYSAPEQTRGPDVDHRADIFALGVIVYELITGKVAFGGRSTLEVIDATRHRHPIPATRLNTQVTKPVASLIEKMINKSPRRRHADMGEVIAEIDAIRQGLPGLARDDARTVREWLRRIFESPPQRPVQPRRNSTNKPRPRG